MRQVDVFPLHVVSARVPGSCSQLSHFIIALFILGAAGWLGKMGAGVAFAVFVIVGPMALIALCLSLFGQWKRRPYNWLPEHLAQEKLAEDAAR